MNFKGWFGERYRHSLAARGISLAIKRLPSTVQYPNKYYPQVSQTAQPFIRKEILAENLEEMNRQIEAEKAFEQITGERMASGTMLEGEGPGSYLSMTPEFSTEEKQVYPLYGTVEKPVVPYWYGENQFMSDEESLEQYGILKLQLAEKLYQQSLRDPMNSIIHSNKISLERKQELMADLKKQAVVQADIMLKQQFGFDDKIDIMAYPMTKMMQREEHLREYNNPSLWPEHLDEPSPFVSYEGFGLPEKGFKMHKRVYPTTESVSNIPYVQPFSGGNVHGSIDTYLLGQQQWAGYIKSLRSQGLDVPFGIRDVNGLAEWYFDKYAGARLAKGQHVSKNDIIAELKQSGRDYLGSGKVSSRTKYISSRSKVAKVPINIDDTVRKVELSGGAYKETEESARGFVNQMKKYGILYDYEEMKDGRWKVYKPVKQ